MHMNSWLFVCINWLFCFWIMKYDYFPFHRYLLAKNNKEEFVIKYWFFYVQIFRPKSYISCFRTEQKIFYWIFYKKKNIHNSTWKITIPKEFLWQFTPPNSINNMPLYRGMKKIIHIIWLCVWKPFCTAVVEFLLHILFIFVSLLWPN